MAHPKTRVVICPRMAAKQKAQLVRFANSLPRGLTLAVGDGVNDVSMLRAAHVGVGLFGNEGHAAVDNSDFAVARFKDLLPLLFVHGRLAYKRHSKLILYSVYKNILCLLLQLTFAFYSRSTALLFDEAIFNTYNLFFTSLPILLVAMFWRELEPTCLLLYPELHRRGMQHTSLNLSLLACWLGSACVHAALLWLLFESFGDELRGQHSASFGLYSALLAMANAKLALMYWWSSVGVGVLGLSLLLWPAWALVLSSSRAVFPGLFAGFQEAMQLPSFWLALPLCVWAAVGFDLCWLAYRRNYQPSLKHVVQERLLLHHLLKRELPPLRDVYLPLSAQ